MPMKSKGFYNHVKVQVVRGLLAIIPIVLSLLVLRFLYLAIDIRIMKILYQFIGFNIPGLGILLVIVLLYLTGVAASNLIGRRILKTFDKLMNAIPLVKSTYKVGRQVANVLSIQDKRIFKRAVLVEYLKPGIWTVGFMTGVVVDRKNNNEKLLKVFVPTPPNPMSGTMVLVRESQIRDPGWTVEQAIETVVSGGLIGPEEIG